LILGKISKFDDNRYQILRLKCTKFDFSHPAGGRYTAAPDPLAVVKGPTSREEEEGKKRKGRGRGNEGRGGTSPSPNILA